MVVAPSGLRFIGQRFPCVIGRGGTRRLKREGDGATPIGVHRVVGMMYRPDRMPAPASWATAIGPRDLWCDAPDHVAYNHLVQAPFSASHEQLRRADALYDLVLVLDWNWPDPVPGLGSAIFIHQWRHAGFPTEGCIAVRRDHLFWIAHRVTPGVRLIVPG